MLKSTVSEQGQTTIPVNVRKAINAPPGATLAWAVSGRKAEVIALEHPTRKRRAYDYLAHLERLNSGPVVADSLLTVTRSHELLP